MTTKIRDDHNHDGHHDEPLEDEDDGNHIDKKERYIWPQEEKSQLCFDHDNHTEDNNDQDNDQDNHVY